jgi:hypothetical protein
LHSTSRRRIAKIPPQAAKFCPQVAKPERQGAKLEPQGTTPEPQASKLVPQGKNISAGYKARPTGYNATLMAAKFPPQAPKNSLLPINQPQLGATQSQLPIKQTPQAPFHPRK